MNAAFPPDFVWGAATSAAQIEGAPHVDGKGESVWDRFAATPGKVADGSTPERACESYTRWREDVAVLRELGAKAYRFSIAWPRLLPRGRGALEPRGFAYYDALIDGLLEAGITPFVTLNHWDTPQALQDEGGWGERSTAEAFVEYASHAVARFGDRVQHWITHNEPWCQANLGHGQGEHAPGLRDPALAVRVAHHLLLAHGWTVAAIRRMQPRAQVGITLILTPCEPASAAPADVDAARAYDGFFNRWFLDPLYRGAYPADAVADRVRWGDLASPEMPFVHAGDLAAIAASTDFLGVNYYSRSVLRAGDDGRPAGVRQVPAEALTEMGWEVYPDGLRTLLLRLTREYAPAVMYVTENGAAFRDEVTPEGGVHDARRVEFLRTHLLAARAAIAEGAPLRGYHAWSLLDNWEWALGYEKRFGLYRIDPQTGKRIEKDSAAFYRSVIAANAVEAVVGQTAPGGHA